MTTEADWGNAHSSAPEADVDMPGVDIAGVMQEVDEARRRAIVATDLCFTISDPHAEDHPLIWANPAFLRMTGYPTEEVLGRNCRFLQGPDTDPAAVARIRAALAAEEPATVTLLNYRKDGTTFWNQLSLSPVYDTAGRLVNYVGVQVDVTARVANDHARAHAMQDAENARQIAVEAQAESEIARADAERARLASEHATARLVQMGAITTALTATLDLDEALTRLTAAVVPAFGDWCVVNLVDDEQGATRQVAALHRDPERRADMDRYLALQPRSLTPASPVYQVLRSGEAVLGSRLTVDELSRHVDSDELVSVVQRLGAASYVVVPLTARRRTQGSLAVVNMPGSRAFTSEDVATLSEVGRRAGLAIDNARLYAREHAAAISLQRTLLPVLPNLPGLAMHAEYHASAQTAEIGGDWYDALALADGRVGLAIGDVMGHDAAAAAAMGQLRSVLRSYAWEGDEPATVLSRLDRLVQGLGMAQFATCCYLRISRRDGVARVDVSNAGHPAPVLLHPDGHAELLAGAPDPVIGVPVDLERNQSSFDVPVGSTLVLYTDGLVEDRHRDIDVGLIGLLDSVEHLAGRPVDAIVPALLAPLLARGLDDDVAVLAVRIEA